MRTTLIIDDALLGKARRETQLLTKRARGVHIGNQLNNLQSLAAMFTDDVVLLSPNEPVLIGKAAE
jgi:hypothetical protein